MQIEAILFDCDGVLVDSESIYTEVELHMLGKIGLVYDPPDYQKRFMGLRSVDFLSRLEADSMAKLNRSLPADFAARLDAACRERLMAELEPMDGVAALLDRFSGKVAVASSSSLDLLHAKLRMTGLHARFDPPYLFGRTDRTRQARAGPVFACGRANRRGAGRLPGCRRQHQRRQGRAGGRDDRVGFYRRRACLRGLGAAIAFGWCASGFRAF